MVKAYRLAINFETHIKAYKKPFGNMDRMPKAKIKLLILVLFFLSQLTSIFLNKKASPTLDVEEN
jgi:hypothetical protein